MSSYAQNYSNVWGSCPLTIIKSSLQIYVFSLSKKLSLHWALPILIIQLDIESLAFSEEIIICKDLTVNIDKPGFHLKINYNSWEVRLCYINKVVQYPNV